jgi:DNA-binding transcriptional regulator YdaS (Cro superfamily)
MKMNGSYGLQQAIKAAGSKAALADKLGIRPQAVGKWTRIPIKRVFDVERLTGISRKILCPEFFAGSG